MTDPDRILKRQEAAENQLFSKAVLVASWRFQLIGPLVDASFDEDARKEARKRLLSDLVAIPGERPVRLSERTLRRWCASYKKRGLKGLIPKGREDQGELRAIPAEAIERALQLRTEDGRRTVPKLIEMLANENAEWAGLKRTTLDRHLRKRGSRRRQQSPAGPFHRFEANAPNDLWQGDTLQGPLVIWQGKTVRVRVVSWLDDCSRMVVHMEGYPDETLPSVEDSLRKAILKYGRPWRIFVDNAQIYSGRSFSIACTDLGITKIHSTPHYPVSRGKQERLFGVLRQQLINEMENLAEPLTLELFNRYLVAWLECYHDKVHSGTQETPRKRYATASVAPRPVSQQSLETAFLQWATRDISVCGEIKFAGNLYHVDPTLAGKNQTIRFDPFDLSTVLVWKEGRILARASSEQIIHRQRPGKPRPPHQRGSEAAQRYLDSLDEAHRQRLQRERNQIPYRSHEEDEIQ